MYSLHSNSSHLHDELLAVAAEASEDVRWFSEVFDGIVGVVVAFLIAVTKGNIRNGLFGLLFWGVKSIVWEAWKCHKADDPIISTVR